MSESKTSAPACEAMSGTRRLAIGQRAESAVNRTDVEAMEQVCLEDVPALLEQLEDVDRLRGELAAVIGENNRLTGAATEIEADRNILRTEQAVVFAALRDALGTSPATVGQATSHVISALSDARAEAARHLGHLRQAHPRHFTTNVLGQRLCGCDGEWPCREQVQLAEEVQRIRDRHPRETDDADCMDADTTFGCQHGPGFHEIAYCGTCDEEWPCAEIAALDGTEADR